MHGVFQACVVVSAAPTTHAMCASCMASSGGCSCSKEEKETSALHSLAKLTLHVGIMRVMCVYTVWHCLSVCVGAGGVYI